MKIFGAKLTACNVTSDGEIVRLDLLDVGGNAVSLRLPFDQAGALSMTLPGLLTKALKAGRNDASARYVYPLGDWLLEGISDCHALIVTLKTTDGFEVSFSATLDACRELAAALKCEATAVAATVPTIRN